jgi:nitroreductase
MSGTNLERLLAQRRSVRAFRAKPVPKSDVAKMLHAARTAPSGGNLQPGRFHALSGAPLSSLKEALTVASESGRKPVSEYSYFPYPMPADLKAKQNATGFALYQALGIERRDVARRKAQFDCNYRFFDAPVGIVVTIHKAMGKGCFMDLGMSLMTLLLAIENLGYGATGIGALANYGDAVHEHLQLDDDEMVVCGVALGIADTEAAINRFRTDRDELEFYATFSGFDD